jgi:hypothetical protein
MQLPSRRTSACVSAIKPRRWQRQAQPLEQAPQAIDLMLASGQASSACVAQTLGLSVRTMQRWLGASGLAFSDLVNEVLTELVQRYLDNPATP